MFTLVSSARKEIIVAAVFLISKFQLNGWFPQYVMFGFLMHMKVFRAIANEKSQKPPFDWYPNSEDVCSDRFF